jgi:hypothetical protein
MKFLWVQSTVRLIILPSFIIKIHTLYNYAKNGVICFCNDLLKVFRGWIVIYTHLEVLSEVGLHAVFFVHFVSLQITPEDKCM